jgi:predicted metal-binding membrane protein
LKQRYHRFAFQVTRFAFCKGGNDLRLSELTRSPFPARPFLPWLTVFVLAILAWIPTLQQALGMLALSAPLFGTMGLAFGPFVWFWALMMTAMMFPALAPVVVVRYHHAEQRTGHWSAFSQMVVFLLGYLFTWTLFGIPTFFLAQLGEQLVFHAPRLGIALGIGLLVAIGLYQMTPLETRALAQCHPSHCDALMPLSARPPFSSLKEGMRHGGICLNCCGGLMLVMVVVGLMNLPWMLLLTVVIFLEKTWRHGARLSFFVGFGLLVFAALALAVPALLAGLYQPG